MINLDEMLHLLKVNGWTIKYKSKDRRWIAEYVDTSVETAYLDGEEENEDQAI